MPADAIASATTLMLLRHYASIATLFGRYASYDDAFDAITR